MNDLSAAERGEILLIAAKIEPSFPTIAYGDELDGPGQWEGIPKELRPIAYAIHLFYLNGGSDQDGGNVEYGLAFSRAGRAVLWTDDRGFHELQIYDHEQDAERACNEEEARQDEGDRVDYEER